MRAGSGVTHSEFNPSSSDQAHLLQIWIMPAERGLKPAYSEWTPPAVTAPKILVISSDGREGSAQIAQDASIYLIRASEPKRIRFRMRDLSRGGTSATAFSLRDGDLVVVE